MVEVEEIAIMFEPCVDDDGMISFIPDRVIEGSFDDESERFVDSDLYSYPHLTMCEKSRGYALRYPINQLSVKYPNNSLKEIKEIFFNEYKNDIYFLGQMEDEFLIFKTDDKTGEDILVIDEDTKMFLMYFQDEKECQNLISEEINPEETTIEKKEFTVTTKNEQMGKKMINPHVLYNQIKETVKGQDDAIKEIVTCVWKNYNSDHSKNMILVGPSGSGKTEILRQLSKKMDIPMMITTVTGMSQAGYIGTGTDEILSNLLIFTKGDVSKAERAIVVLDEIDKIAYGNSESGKVSTDGVQNELLKIVEDGTFCVSFDQGGFPIKEMINTANITFIGVGAFNGMLTTRKEKSIGFGQDITTKEIKKEKIDPEDLINYGLKPELVGRMGKIVRLNDLDLDTMKDIIKNSNKSAYNSEIKFLNKHGIKLDFTTEDEIVEEIAKLAMAKKIGARSIEGIVTEMFSNIEFDISNPDDKYTELQISKETVTNPKKYVLKK